MKKWKFTGETKQWGKTTLRRIVAVRHFGVISPGELGGWIEKESNLSHSGTAWVFEEAEVMGGVRIAGNAEVFGPVHIDGSGGVKISGNIWVSGNRKEA